jgi:peptidoglycan hydrolase CwlO-like protein
MISRNQFPKPIDEILVAIGTIHKKLDDLKKEIDEIKQVINEVNTKDKLKKDKGWFWN